jgi:hypothetical protein
LREKITRVEIDLLCDFGPSCFGRLLGDGPSGFGRQFGRPRFPAFQAAEPSEKDGCGVFLRRRAGRWFGIAWHLWYGLLGHLGHEVMGELLKRFCIRASIRTPSQLDKSESKQEPTFFVLPADGAKKVMLERFCTCLTAQAWLESG